MLIAPRTEDEQDHQDWTKHDFQRERFQWYMELIEELLNSLKSSAHDDLTSDELYNLCLKERYNFIICNCLLVLVKIINFEDRGNDRLQSRGFAKLAQQEKRDVRDLKRNVEKACEALLRSLRAAGVSLQAQRGVKGLYTSADLNNILLPLRPCVRHSGFQYNLRLSVSNMAIALNGAYTYKGRGIYSADRDELARAFRIGASYVEWAMGKHAASTQSRTPPEDLTISSRFNKLTVNSSPQRTRVMHTTTILPYTPASVPAKWTRIEYTEPSSSRTATRSPSLTESRFGLASPARARRSPSTSQYRSASSCTQCNQTGHTFGTCPKTKCFQCKWPIKRTSNVAGSRRLITYDF
jgi:hypothetical protein